MRILVSMLTAMALSAAATAQCASLSVTGSGAPGTDLTFDLNATPLSFAAVLIGDTAGTTTINVGQVSVDLGLLLPVAPLPLGLTDAAGDASLTVSIPPGFPSADLLAQGVAVSFGTPPNFNLSFCTSNVASFHVGP